MQTDSVERGSLRVYLGAAPGVGKTFAMLAEGQRRAERGTDVVVGLVETHGRAKTEAAIGDLEVLPRRVVDHGGMVVGELDVAAVLARRPEVVLVDELAHTNAVDSNVAVHGASDQAATDHGGPGRTAVDGDPAGGGRVKRWQDVEILLQAGIDVITTVNIQHLESLNDVVTSITGIRQRETVPDRVVRAAEAIELVDMSPQALRRRMAHGNVYAADKIDAALSNYFREGNLAALRELALLWLADRVDDGLDRYRQQHRIAGTWPTRERVVVGVSGGPETLALMRRAARIASRTAGGEWLAVYVSRQDGLAGVSPEALERIRRTAEELGGTFQAVVADNSADGLLDVARGVNASQVLIGASRRGRVSALLQPGVGEEVIARSGEIDVHVVTHDYARRAGRRRLHQRVVSRARRIAGYLLAVVGTATLAAGLWLTPDLHGLPTESLLMLTMVVGTALLGGLWPSVLAAVLSSLALNFLFVPPTGTLTIEDPENAFAIVVFIVVGVAVASVVDRSARRTQEAIQARTEANTLAVLAHSLLRSGDDPNQLLRQTGEALGMTGAAWVRTSDDTGSQSTVAAWGVVEPADVSCRVEAGPGLVLVLHGRTLSAADQRLLTAYAAHFAVLEERRRAEQDAVRTRELDEGNRTKTALLAAVSHDLRTPLAAIKAATSSLRNTSIAWSVQDREDLLATVEESADRLDALVANLLDMSRLQTQTITARAVELDLATAAEWTLANIPGAEAITVAAPDDLPTVIADPGLLDRVVANVVENALKHAGAAKIAVTASAWTIPDGAVHVSLRVVDHGPGVPTRALGRIFEPFQRMGDVPAGDGVGLGLAVARGLTEAMNGTVTAEPTPGGGLTVVIDLPAATVDHPLYPTATGILT